MAQLSPFRLPDAPERTDLVARYYRAPDDPTRLRVLESLRTEGELSARELTCRLGHRPHRALGQAPPLGSGEPAVFVPAGRVVRRDRLGGLLHEYAQVA